MPTQPPAQAETASEAAFNRDAATRFYKLALGHVRSASKNRRWMRELAAKGTGAAGFYPDKWTPQGAALVRQYRDLARKHRAMARAVSAPAQLIAAE